MSVGGQRPIDQAIGEMDEAGRIRFAELALLALEPSAVFHEDLVDPIDFRKLRARLTNLDPAVANDVADECARLLDELAEEPLGAAFYTYRALSGLAYLAQAIAGQSEDGARNIARTLEDAAWFADQEGCDGVYEDSLRLLEAPSEASAQALGRRLAEHARSL